MPKKNSSRWFRAIRGSYLPSSAMGLLVYLLYVAYILTLIYEWLIRSGDIWSMLTVVLPLVVLAAIVTQYVASKHSK